MELESTVCCLCRRPSTDPVGVGRDFEYDTSPAEFLAVQCRECQVVYLDPRPTSSELSTIYPDNYHAFDFEPAGYGVVYRVRRRLEARRLLNSLGPLPARARVLDVGCGDGFHLDVLRDFAPDSWQLEGVDVDRRAVAAGRAKGLKIHEGTIESLEQADRTVGQYDAAMMIMLVEHVSDPVAVLESTRRLVRPGGRILVVTDNTNSPDFKLSRRRHWGGYHFPRHWYLFNSHSLATLGVKANLEVASMSTIVSPVNWTFSLRNLLVDMGAPQSVTRHLGLTSPFPLAAFTALDLVMRLAGRGGVLSAVFRRPEAEA